MIQFSGTSWQQARREALALLRYLDDPGTYASNKWQNPGICEAAAPAEATVVLAIDTDTWPFSITATEALTVAVLDA